MRPAIETAHRHGCHVITVDYLPNNIAHHYSDEYHNVSILDQEAVLSLAKKLDIDGILSYAVDPGVVTAAYVAEKMGLSFACSYDTACILQDKARFRQFLTANGFNTPKAKCYTNTTEALKVVDDFCWPVIVKPVDSAGSKGVTKVETPVDLAFAIAQALKESHSGRFIIEEFIESEGLPSGSESFFVNGELKYNAIYDQWFDVSAANPYVPSAECWPAQKPESVLAQVRKDLQRLGSLLDFKSGLFNIEWRIGRDGRVYLMEVSPRAGGNRLAEILNYATDVDIIDAEVSKAIGFPLPEVHEPQFQGYYCILVLHSNKNGELREVRIHPHINKNLLEKEIRIKPDGKVNAFTGANQAIGTLFLHFNTLEEMHRALVSQDSMINIIIDNN